MIESQKYVLGQSEQAARRLQIQDAHFGETSELLLDDVAIQPKDRIVELGCGPGGFSKRILQRLGPDGVLLGVDYTEGLLEQARAGLADKRFQPVLADVSKLGPWLTGANVVVGRAMLHHIPMVEFMLGRLRVILPKGVRVGFIEPDFRSPLARLAHLENTGRPELSPLRFWAIAINNLYLANRLSPSVGATLAQTLATAGFRNVRSGWSECRSDNLMIENMIMFYEEVNDQLQALGILTAAQMEEQCTQLRALNPTSLPAAWGIYRVACET
jgi:ubiquinone/menaquinone biosynthesis C-methylase UbiE